MYGQPKLAVNREGADQALYQAGIHAIVMRMF